MSKDARFYRAAICAASVALLGASYRTPNFVVTAATDEIAQAVGQTAEKHRRELATEWLGKPMPNWSQPCPINVEVADHLGAGGATSFVFNHGEVFGWQMNIQGPLNRVLDSVLPHEVTHTIFASHFRQPLPRWADEGACTTVEHSSERTKNQKMLVAFLRTGRGIPFSQMFAMREYPHDILPLYAQGHSLASFLIGQGGKHKFLSYLTTGLREDEWIATTKQFYGFESLAVLQDSWLDWVRRGSPLLPAADSGRGLLAKADARPRPEANLIYRGQSEDPQQTADRPMPIDRTFGAAPAPAPADVAPPGESAERLTARNLGWHSAGNRAPDAQPLSSPTEVAIAPAAAVGAAPTADDRAQASGQPGRPLLEWSRPVATSRAAPAATGPQATAARPQGSIYEARVQNGATMRR